MERQNLSESIKVSWVKLERDESGKVKLCKGGGVYIFLFNHYPFYVGTAEWFEDRLGSHHRYFRQGKRTYLDMSQIKQSPWTKDIEGISKEDFFKKVYVPGLGLEFNLEKSQAFWKSLEIYAGEIQDPRKEVITSLERKIQLSLYNEKLKIPDTDSTFFGKQESNKLVFEFEHDLSRVQGDGLHFLR